MRLSRFVGATLLTLGCQIEPEYPDSYQNSCIHAGVRTGDYSGVVALSTTSTNGDTYACSGVLISPTVVLTAAHCLDKPGISEFKVHFGPNTHVEHTTVAAYEWEVHPGYEWKEHSPHDIGKLYLSEPMGPSIPMHLEAVPHGAEIEMVGYGVTESSGEFGYRRVGKDNISFLGWDEFYTSTSGSSGDHGDSGGPALYNGKVIGVLSKRYTDNANGYTRVVSHLEFIGSQYETDCEEDGDAIDENY